MIVSVSDIGPRAVDVNAPIKQTNLIIIRNVEECMDEELAVVL